MASFFLSCSTNRRTDELIR